MAMLAVCPVTRASAVMSIELLAAQGFMRTADGALLSVDDDDDDGASSGNPAPEMRWGSETESDSDGADDRWQAREAQLRRAGIVEHRTTSGDLSAVSVTPTLPAPLDVAGAAQTWYAVPGVPMHGAYAALTAEQHAEVMGLSSRFGLVPHWCGLGRDGHMAALQHLVDTPVPADLLLPAHFLLTDPMASACDVGAAHTIDAYRMLESRWPVMELMGRGEAGAARACAAMDRAQAGRRDGSKPTGTALGETGATPGPVGIAAPLDLPPGLQSPEVSPMASWRARVDRMRPSTESPTSLREVIRASGLPVSPRIGGLGETRTKATLITELRANLQLPVLDFGDPVKSFEHRTPKNIFSLTDAVPLGLPVVEDAPAAGDGAAVGVDEPPLVAPGATESAASAVLATRIAPTSAHYLALASVVLFLACLVATVLVVGASPGVLVATSTLALSPARATTWLGAAYGGAQEVATFMTVTAGTHRVAWTAGLLFAYWWLSTAYHGGALAALTYVCTQAVAAARRAPNRMRQLTRMLCIVALAAALNVAIGGVHGQPTETHIARTHGLDPVREATVSWCAAARG
jgi:hypothetical protein